MLAHLNDNIQRNAEAARDNRIAVHRKQLDILADPDVITYVIEPYKAMLRKVQASAEADCKFEGYYYLDVLHAKLDAIPEDIKRMINAELTVKPR